MRNAGRKPPRPSALRFCGAFSARKGSFRSVLFTGFAGLVAVGVPLNALFMQEGRRPAAAVALKMPPIDAARQSQPAPPSHPRPAPPSVAKTEAPRQEPARSRNGEADGKELRSDRSIARERGAAQERRRRRRRPQKRPQEHRRQKHDAKNNDPKNKSVIFAQRALAKLGYALHQDGVYGGTTRQAIEKFERSNGLPVKGELSPKILRLLGARAGVAFK